jgi:hypothetical protein
MFTEQDIYICKGLLDGAQFLAGRGGAGRRAACRTGSAPCAARLAPPASRLLPPSSSCLLPPASCLLPPVSCLLPPASFLPPPAPCLPPPASFLLLPPASCLLSPASRRMSRSGMFGPAVCSLAVCRVQSSAMQRSAHDSGFRLGRGLSVHPHVSAPAVTGRWRSRLRHWCSAIEVSLLIYLRRSPAASGP